MDVGIRTILKKYEDCIDELERRIFRRGIHYTLTNFQSNLGLLNNPQTLLKNVIHVAGTNGKGSTVAILSHALQKEGYSVGTFTSPHIDSYLERFTLNGCSISKPLFSKYFNQVIQISGFQTEFEILTAMSFLFFKDTTPDFIIVETGLGGRFDTTNVVSPILNIITKIGLDHQEILGQNLVEIAQEKAGIIKSQCPVISLSSQKIEVKLILEKEANLNSAQLKFVSPLQVIPQSSALQGDYQKENIALALDAFKFLTHSKSDVDALFLSYLDTINHWGRFTQISNHPVVICDGAHNQAAISSLLKSIESKAPHTCKLFIVGIHKNKNFQDILRPIILGKHRIFYCPFDDNLATPFEKITRYFPDIPEVSLDELPLLIKEHDDKTIVITGSFYFISHVKPILDPCLSLEV